MLKVIKKILLKTPEENILFFAVAEGTNLKHRESLLY